jgi:hypothetical protein
VIGRHLTTAAAVVIAVAGLLPSRAARGYTFVDQIPEDACMRARSFDPQDASEAAQHARRACRLEVFDQRMADQRRQAVAAQQEAREAWLDRWMETTQPGRVIHPMAVELFAGSGIVNYGAAFSWDVLRMLELGARVGQRQMSCATPTSNNGADCTRTTWGLGARAMLLDKDISPFIGAAFSTTSAPLKINHYNQMTMQTMFLDGEGRANSVSGSAGLHLGMGNVRVSLEYLYEYVFYTGANLHDMQHHPSEDLKSVWNESLDADHHGVRFQVGFAF